MIKRPEAPPGKLWFNLDSLDQIRYVDADTIQGGEVGKAQYKKMENIRTLAELEEEADERMAEV